MQTTTLIRIARLLILHASTMVNPGILKGKMGLILFFFHLSRHVDRPLYEEFAEQLLDEVYEDIRNTDNKQIVYQECAEVAWGLLYLIRHRFVEGEREEVTATFDPLIIQNPFTYPDTKIRAAVHYLIASKSGNTASGIPPYFTQDLLARINLKPEQWKYELLLLDKLLKQEPVSDHTDSFLQKALNPIRYTPDGIFSNRPIGIEADGLTGIGLKIMFTNSADA